MTFVEWVGGKIRAKAREVKVVRVCSEDEGRR